MINNTIPKEKALLRAFYIVFYYIQFLQNGYFQSVIIPFIISFISWSHCNSFIYSIVFSLDILQADNINSLQYFSDPPLKSVKTILTFFSLVSIKGCRRSEGSFYVKLLSYDPDRASENHGLREIDTSANDSGVQKLRMR